MIYKLKHVGYTCTKCRKNMLLLACGKCYLCADASAPEHNRLSHTHLRLDTNSKNTHMDEV